MCSVNADAIRFINQKCIFSLLFLEPRFLFNHYLHNLFFGDLVNNIHLEGTVSQKFDLSPSFHFMTKNR